MPRVSIIMNVRNGASFLREALNSVTAQTFQDWESIVWDDCSTDDSPRIVSEYQDQRIRYFLSPEDTPLGEARNNAIRQAKGEWLAFLDQDDIWLPRKLQQQMALADNNTGMIYGRAIQFYPSGKERDYDYAHEFQPLPEGDIFAQLFIHGCFIAMSSAVLRRSAVEEVGPDSGIDSNCSGLLSLCRRGAKISGASCSGTRLPLSHACGQHVAVKTAPPLRGTPLDCQSVGRTARTTDRRVSPDDILHWIGPGRDATFGQLRPGGYAPVHGRVGGLADVASVRPCLSRAPAKS